MKRLLLCLLCLLLVLGGYFFLIRRHQNRLFATEITSFDELTTIQFGSVASDEPEYEQAYFWTQFTLPNGCDFFKDCIKGKPYYVRSLSKDLTPSEGATGYYLLKQDNHWFVVQTKQNVIFVRELISAYYTDTCLTFPVPFILPGLPQSESFHISWDEMICVNSFEELISFYTDLDYPIEISAKKDSFVLSAYYADRGYSHTLTWYPSCVEVKQEKDGISVALIKKQ